MSHARAQIRAAVISALTGLASTGDRVAAGDPYAVDARALPCLRVMTPEEVLAPDFDAMDNIVGRRVTVAVVGYAAGAASEEDLDTIAAEIETAVDGGTLSGLVKRFELQRTTKALTGDARDRLGTLHMEFAADYRAVRGAPETIIP